MCLMPSGIGAFLMKGEQPEEENTRLMTASGLDSVSNHALDDFCLTRSVYFSQKDTSLKKSIVLA